MVVADPQPSNSVGLNAPATPLAAGKEPISVKVAPITPPVVPAVAEGAPSHASMKTVLSAPLSLDDFF